MKTNNLDIIEIEAIEFYKIQGGTSIPSEVGIPSPFEIKTIYNPLPSPNILI